MKRPGYLNHLLAACLLAGLAVVLPDASRAATQERPDEELRLTENAQPALMAASMAVLRVLEAGESCDTAISSGTGSCPTVASCHDGDACTSDACDEVADQDGVQAHGRIAGVPVGQLVTHLHRLSFVVVIEIREGVHRQPAFAAAGIAVLAAAHFNGEKAFLNGAVTAARRRSTHARRSRRSSCSMATMRFTTPLPRTSSTGIPRWRTTACAGVKVLVYLQPSDAGVGVLRLRIISARARIFASVSGVVSSSQNASCCRPRRAISATSSGWVT